MNKWDTIPNKNQQTATYYEEDVREKLRLLNWAPIVYSTAIAGHSVDKYVPEYSIPFILFLYNFCNPETCIIFIKDGCASCLQLQKETVVNIQNPKEKVKH